MYRDQASNSTSLPLSDISTRERTAFSRQLLFGNISSLMALQGLNYLIPVVTLPYLVRVLGIGPFGMIAVAQAFAAYFVILTDYGFNLSATRKIAQQHNDASAISRTFSAVLTIKAIFVAVGIAIIVVVLLAIPHFRRDAAIYAVTYLTVIGSALLPSWFFQGMQQMRTIAVLTGVTKLLALCALFVFVRGPGDYMMAAALPPLGVLISGIVGLWICVGGNKVRYVVPTLASLRDQLADGFHLFTSTASITLYTNTNVFLVGLLAGNVEAGYFSTGDKVVRGAQGILSPVLQAVFPHVNTMATASRESALIFLRRLLLWAGLISLAPSLALLVFAHPLVVLAFGNKALESVAVLRWMALLPFVLTLGNVLGVQTLITFGMEKQISRIYISAGVINVALCVPLALYLGAPGAAACVTLVELCVTAAAAVCAVRLGLFQRPHADKICSTP